MSLARSLLTLGRGALVVLAMAAAPAGAVAADPAGAACSPSSPGVVATLGTWSSEGPSITDPAAFAAPIDEGLVFDVRGLGVGLGRVVARETHGSPRDPAVPIVLRTVRRRGRAIRLELCHGRRRLATVGPPARGSRVVGVSVNGDRLAWRTWRPGRRGALTVGRLADGRVVSRRRTAVPAVARRHAVNGRILVMPDGTTTWSLEVAGRASVWLWPAGAAARRLALPDARRHADEGWDVRVVDTRHVVLGDTATVLRYGPATPGRCPSPVAARTDALGDRSLVTVPGAGGWEISDGFGWTQTLVCDPRVGDYVHVHASSYRGDKYGNGSGGSLVVTLATAGVLVQTDTLDALDAYATQVTPFATEATTIALGVVDDPRTLAAVTPPQPPGAPVRPGPLVGARVLPGAVAWVAGDPAASERPSSAPREVWLADADGARVVGRLPVGSPVDPGLTLTPTSVGWSGTDGSSSAPVRPVPGDVVHRVPAAGG